ncbi:MAG: ferredoxin, partial [Candidatus Portnoybacteria bacterium]|nr:ferredoxin [Candidatus Portnoybacteria bacterium]
MKIKIDKDKCIGCGSCVAVCSDCFEMDSDNKAVLKDSGDMKCAQEAVDVCPVQA